MTDVSEFLKATGGSGTSGGEYQKAATSIGQILDLYIVHFVVSVVFIIGGIMLIDRYAFYATKPYNAWDDLFYALGALALALNVGFCIGLFLAWIWKNAKILDRQDDGIHWLHALSIFTAAFSMVWGVLALILTFGTTLTGSVTDNVEVAGYFMVMLGVVYCLYLVIRYVLGLAGRNEKDTPGIQARTELDRNELLAALRNSGGGGIMAAQPIFGGGSGAAAFGGIDLSGLQGSSMSTLPPTQHAVSSGAQQGCGPQPGCYPMMMQMPMMMGQAACTPNPDAVIIA